MSADAGNLAKISALLDRAGRALAQEVFARDIRWAQFLAEGEQWCRVTDQGIEIIPRSEIYKPTDTTPCVSAQIRTQEKDG